MNTKTFTAVLEILLYFQAESPVARQQALHLGDIAKSRRARGTQEETRKWGEAGRGLPLAASPLAGAFSRGSPK